MYTVTFKPVNKVGIVRSLNSLNNALEAMTEYVKEAQAKKWTRYPGFEQMIKVSGPKKGQYTYVDTYKQGEITLIIGKH